MFTLLLFCVVGVATASTTNCSNDDLASFNQAYSSQPRINCTGYGGDGLGSCISAECFEYRKGMADLTPDCWFANQNLHEVALSFTSIPSCDGSNLAGGATIGSGSSGVLMDCAGASTVDQVSDGLDQFQIALTESDECHQTDAFSVLQLADCNNASLACVNFMATQLSLLFDCSVSGISINDMYALELAACAGSKSASTSENSTGSASDSSKSSSAPAARSFVMVTIVAAVGLVLLAAE